MPLILTLSARRGGPPLESRTLSEGTMTIGRAAICEWVLADPDRLLSKTHCMIGVEGSRYVLTDLSTNGVFINGAREPTARDSRTFLTDGDSFALGSYTMMVTEVDVAAPSRATPSVGRAASPPADAFGTDGDDPFGAEPGTLFRHPIPPRPTKPLRLDDPFGPGPGGGLPAAGLGAADDDLFQGLAPDPSWLGPAQPDNADAARHAFAAPKAVAPVRLEDLDLDALLGEEPPTAPPRPPASGPVAAPPVPLQAAQETPAPIGTQAAAPPAADAAALLSVFLTAAGVPDMAKAGLDPQATLHLAGTVFRAMAEGLREVLMSRASIKNELRVEQTMLQARNNNALKFSITPDDAIAVLLRPPRAGYLAPVEAAHEACRDIQAHEMAVMAGVQTALTGLLKRFDPAALQASLQPGHFDGILPSAKKARLWEAFCAAYAEIARRAEDDFQSVFGREFAKAYDAQMRELGG